jgi:hypothetical protein
MNLLIRRCTGLSNPLISVIEKYLNEGKVEIRRGITLSAQMIMRKIGDTELNLYNLARMSFFASYELYKIGLSPKIFLYSYSSIEGHIYVLCI